MFLDLAKDEGEVFEGPEAETRPHGTRGMSARVQKESLRDSGGGEIPDRHERPRAQGLQQSGSSPRREPARKDRCADDSGVQMIGGGTIGITGPGIAGAPREAATPGRERDDGGAPVSVRAWRCGAG